MMSAESLRMPLFSKASLTRNMLSVSPLSEEDAALQIEDDWEDVEQMVVELESLPVVNSLVNHTWVVLKGTTITHSAWHSSNVCSTLDIKLKGGKQKALNLDQSKVKTTATASGSGLQETWFQLCIHSRSKKINVTSTKLPHTTLENSSNRHSISCLSTRDSNSASM